MRALKWIVGIASALVVLLVALAACNTDVGVTRGATSTAPSATPSTTPTVAATDIDDGTYEVGTDIVPGKYRAPGSDGNGAELCYWERAKNDSGELSAIIANSVAPGAQNVTLKQGETFKTNGCGKWVKR